MAAKKADTVSTAFFTVWNMIDLDAQQKTACRAKEI